ncbi:MAG: UPF0280 family protein [Candidatus Omnitrophica bacterium]|nr:UPF0280 family protein [Candidatus Omnitrophota bacterium]MBU4478119.1 UPF0280 family protein [Candidatus Omnitrophota bacterium]
MYKKRNYRNLTFNDDLLRYEVSYFESNLYISSKINLEDTAGYWLVFYHNQISAYIDKNPLFAKTLVPIAPDPGAPAIIRAMIKASAKANVGPMAAVAGAIAEFVGRKLLRYSSDVIVENGGDIFIASQKERRIGIFAGIGNVYNKLVISIPAQDTPCGICTSSGRIGHSLSFGNTSATIVLCKSAVTADAFATAIGNLVKHPEDMPAAINQGRKNKAIRGLLIITDTQLAGYGAINLDVLDSSAPSFMVE